MRCDDLPNFVVNAKPSKPYYLPGDREAEIEINADYLFRQTGHRRHKVRVVEETSREWNYKEQKYDIDEGEVRQGSTDSQENLRRDLTLRKPLTISMKMTGENTGTSTMRPISRT